jgi:hypothetical protein
MTTALPIFNEANYKALKNCLFLVSACAQIATLRRLVAEGKGFAQISVDANGNPRRRQPGDNFPAKALPLVTHSANLYAGWIWRDLPEAPKDKAALLAFCQAVRAAWPKHYRG